MGPGSGQPQGGENKGRGGRGGGRGFRGNRGARWTSPPGREGGAGAQLAQLTQKGGKEEKIEKKTEENMTKAAMGWPEERVPVNGSVVDCQPDTWVVKVGGQLYVVAFFDTGSAADFCTKSFAKKFSRQHPGQTHRTINMGSQKVRIPVYEQAHVPLHV